MSQSKGPFVNSLVAVGTSSAQLLAENPHRGYLLIQNNSAEPVWLCFGAGPAVVNECMLLDGGASFEPAKIPTNSIKAIAANACNVTVVEG